LWYISQDSEKYVMAEPESVDPSTAPRNRVDIFNCLQTERNNLMCIKTDSSNVPVKFSEGYYLEIVIIIRPISTADYPFLKYLVFSWIVDEDVSDEYLLCFFKATNNEDDDESLGSS
jgi:hypothetical protein